MINRKTLLKSLIIIALLIIIIVTAIHIRNTLARYETTTATDRDVDVAFWIVENSFQSQRLLIEDIYPSTNPFEYTFTVNNFDANDKIAETDMEYEIVITATTNLPLSYEISKNGTTFAKGENVFDDLYQDANGTYYRKIKFSTEANPYPFKMDTIIAELNDSGVATGKYVKTKITDTYTLKVTFPKANSAYEEYADLMEDVNIELSARQVIDE